LTPLSRQSGSAFHFRLPLPVIVSSYFPLPGVADGCRRLPPSQSARIHGVFRHTSAMLDVWRNPPFNVHWTALTAKGKKQPNGRNGDISKWSKDGHITARREEGRCGVFPRIPCSLLEPLRYFPLSPLGPLIQPKFSIVVSAMYALFCHGWTHRFQWRNSPFFYGGNNGPQSS